jgi:RNA polymerase-binding transcription factor
MDKAQTKRVLIEKQTELRGQIAALENAAREGAGTEVEDPIDTVVSTEAKAGAFEASTRQREMLKEIDDAFLRLEDGTYGKCFDCGRPIEPARLEAVPWTPYCLEDQEKHDREVGSPE